MFSHSWFQELSEYLYVIFSPNCLQDFIMARNKTTENSSQPLTSYRLVQHHGLTEEICVLLAFSHLGFLGF